MLSLHVSLPDPGTVISVDPGVAPEEPKAPDWVSVLLDAGNGQSIPTLMLMFNNV